jgi:hypothetical protein
MKTLVFSLFTLFTLSINAQNELYFSNTPSDSIKISKLDCSHLGISSFSRNNMVPLVSIGYFRELRLSNTVGLIIDTNIKNVLTTRDDFINSPGVNTEFKSSFIDAIHGSFSIEPRWYYGYKNRYLNGKKTVLNSGWFVSLPINYESGSLNDIYPRDMGYGYSLEIPLGILLGNYISASPQIGYRYAFSEKLLCEASLKYSIEIYTSNEYLSENSNTGYLNCKIGYCF